ncbi:MAG: helix-turn-helix domain-containing protein [Clostridiales bacterium]|nr:helix-turn-helix domain-containing protein [Clostridiales bacterium]
MMSDFILVPTGRIIKEYLEEYGISQKVLCKRIGSSERHVSNLLNGNTRITEEFALKLEKVLTDVPASYWLNYEAKYREQIARIEEENKLNQCDLNELAKIYRFNEVFKGLELTLFEQAIEMLKILKISSFDNFVPTYSDLKVAFMEDGGNFESIVVWLKICDSEAMLQNESISEVKFSKKTFLRELDILKKIALNENIERSIKNCRRFLNSHGIYLTFVEPLKNSKVRGALTLVNNKPAIHISGRFKTHDHIWFAIMHEIGHLVMHFNNHETLISYNNEDGYVINKIEEEANFFARDFFLSLDSLCYFDKYKINDQSILLFAKEHNVLPGMVVARLQHDGYLSFEKFNKHKIYLNKKYNMNQEIKIEKDLQ